MGEQVIWPLTLGASLFECQPLDRDHFQGVFFCALSSSEFQSSSLCWQNFRKGNVVTWQVSKASSKDVVSEDLYVDVADATQLKSPIATDMSFLIELRMEMNDIMLRSACTRKKRSATWNCTFLLMTMNITILTCIIAFSKWWKRRLCFLLRSLQDVWEEDLICCPSCHLQEGWHIYLIESNLIISNLF